MKKLFQLIIGISILFLWGQVLAQPPAVPVPKKATTAEMEAGTETRSRTVSPALVKSAIDALAGAYVEDDAYGAGWNADTTNAPSQNAVYDAIHTYDTDDDGDIDNIDGAVGGGDITGVGPGGLGAGDALTDGYATTGTSMFIWEGTSVDGNELTIIAPEDPGADVNITLPADTGTLLCADDAGTSLTALNGENIQNDTIDDDSIDFGDITLDDFVSAGSDFISVASDDIFDFTREDSGAVTITSSDDDANADLTVVAGGTGALTLGGASNTSITATTDGGSVTLDGYVAVGGTDPADTGVVRLENATGIYWEDGTEAYLLHVDDTGLITNLELEIDGTLDADGIVALGDGGDNFSVASDGIDIDTAGNITNAGTISSGKVTSSAAFESATGLFDRTGADALTVGSADVTVITLQTDDTGDGTDLVVPAQSINGSEMLNNTVTATQLSATLTMADGDIIDLSGITHTAATDEGIVLPTWANITPTSDKKFLAADGSNLKLYNGGWVTIGAEAAPTDGTYLTLSLDATLSDERVLTAGNALDFTDGGAGSTLTIAFDPTEVSADGTDTWSDGSQATVVWTFDITGTDQAITFGDGVTTFNDAVTVTDTLTATNGLVLGTSKTITGTTGVTLGDNTQTWAINSSDWDIDATGIMTGIGNVTSDGVVTSTGFTIGSAAITEAELEILDGATLTTTQINYLASATGTTGTTNTNVVFSASPTFTGTVVAADIDGSGTFSANLFTPDAADGADIGSATLEFSDIYLADGSIIKFGNDQDISLTHAADTGLELNGNFNLYDEKAIDWGTTNDWQAYYDETTTDSLIFTTTQYNGSADDTAMFRIVVNDGSGTLDADQEVFEILNDTTELFSVDEDGDVYLSGSLLTAASEDPSVVLDEATASDTDYWYGINADQEGDNDDTFEIGTGTTPGSNSVWSIDGSGNVITDGNTTTDSLILEGGTYDTTIDPGTPTESVTYQWPLADGTNGQVVATNGSGVLSFEDVTATPAGASGDVQYNNTVMGAEAAFNYNATNNTLSLTQAASNPTLQVGDGTFSWNFTPQVGIEGVLEVDSDIAVEDDIYMDSDAAVQHWGEDADVTVTHDADDGLFFKSLATTDDNPFVLTIQTGETDIAAADVLGGIYFQAPDEGTGTDAILVAAGIEAVSEGDFSSSSNATKLSFKVGASEVASEKAYLASDGDFFTTGSIYPTGGDDFLGVTTDDIFDFTRNDSGVVTITASDDDATAALTVLPGGAAALTLGGASTTSATVTTDGGNVVMDGNVAIGADPADDSGDIRLGNGAIIAWEDGTEATITHVDETGWQIPLDLSLMFGDTAVFIESDDDGYLDLDADTGIRLNGAVTGSSTITGTTSVIAPLFDAAGDEDLDIGSADVDDVTIITDGGTIVLDGTITGATGLTLGSATVDAGSDLIMIQGAQTDDPQFTVAMSDDANGDVTMTTANGDDADITINASDDIYLDPEGLGVVIGDNAAEDYVITFDADNADGTITWDEDPGAFLFSHDITTSGDTITVGDADDPYIAFGESDGTDWWLGVDDTGNSIEIRNSVTVGTNVMMELSEAGSVTFGDGTDDDIVIKADNDDTDGTITRYADEKTWEFSNILGIAPQSYDASDQDDTDFTMGTTGTSSIILMSGDDDGDNDSIDLQNPTRAGQIVRFYASANIDANDTITVDTTTDSTCTGCTAVVLDEVGDSFECMALTTSLWNCYQLNEVP